MGNANTRSSGGKKFRKNRRMSDTCVVQRKSVADLDELGPPRQKCSTPIPPTIRINDSFYEEMPMPIYIDTDEKHHYQSDKACSLQNMKSLSSSVFDFHNTQNFNSLPDLIMRPLSRSSHLPVKHMRTYSYRSMSVDDNVLNKEVVTCDLIKSSWAFVTNKLDTEYNISFGVYAFKRIFDRNREFRRIFELREHESIEKLNENSHCLRHARPFTATLSLAVRHAEEFEIHVSPTIFKYGERHYTRALEPYMNEERIRFVCAQVVCSVCDLSDEVQPECVEAWIELMRLVGTKFLDGFDCAKLTAQNKISINTTDSRLFLVL